MLSGGIANRAAGETFADYMVVFGSERRPNVANHAHTFAAFLQTPDDASLDPGTIKPLSISWLPRTLVIKPLELNPEPGGNLELIETIDWVLKPDPEDPGVETYLYAWGPFRIVPLLCEHAEARASELDLGRVQYVVEDFLFRPHRATNCIHALSDLGLTTCLLHTLGSHGREASWKVLHYLAPWIQNPSQTHKKVLKAFGLAPYEERIRFLDYQPNGVLDFVRGPQEAQAATRTG